MEERGEDQAKQTTKKDIGKRRRQSKTNDRKKWRRRKKIERNKTERMDERGKDQAIKK